jgi:hypothetical protein
VSGKNSVDIVHAFWDEVWDDVRDDGKLLSNHVERAALEQLQRLSRST